MLSVVFPVLKVCFNRGLGYYLLVFLVLRVNSELFSTNLQLSLLQFKEFFDEIGRRWGVLRPLWNRVLIIPCHRQGNRWDFSR